MSNSWTNQVSSADGDEEETEGGQAKTWESFEDKLEEHLDNGSVSDIPELDLVENVKKVDDDELLRDVWLELEGEKKNIVKNELEGRDALPDDEEESAQPEIKSAKDMTDDSQGKEPEDGSQSGSAAPEPSEGPPQPDHSVPVDVAAERDRRYKVLVWGPPGLFKTHFGYTSPEPVAIIDTERKADDIAHKFADKNIQIWQPENFHEAQDALQEALDWLQWYLDNEGKRGTVVVDSMSEVWEWAKTAYKREAYPMTDNEEVTLSSNIGSSKESDWAHIKGMHNDEFRQWMEDAPFHFVWTCGETEDFNAAISGEGGGDTPMKAEGEKNNVHCADSIIRARYDENGNKVGDLTKSNFTDNKFLGLERPTFPKLRSAIERIEEGERKDESRESVEDDLDVEIVKVHPQMRTEDDD
ncbi:MAG: AAA family ATPase [Halobacteria archaeon]